MADKIDTAATAPAPVHTDEALISPSSPSMGRKNSLEKQLAHRPERQELVEKNILLSSHAAPSLQEKQKELERHMRADSLNDKISHRPSPETLLKEGVLREDPRWPDEDTRAANEKYAEAIEDEYAKREGGA